MLNFLILKGILFLKRFSNTNNSKRIKDIRRAIINLRFIYCSSRVLKLTGTRLNVKCTRCKGVVVDKTPGVFVSSDATMSVFKFLKHVLFSNVHFITLLNTPLRNTFTIMVEFSL